MEELVKEVKIQIDNEVITLEGEELNKFLIEQDARRKKSIDFFANIENKENARKEALKKIADATGLEIEDIIAAIG